MDQIVQVAGSLLILTAFIAAQRGWLSTESRLYSRSISSVRACWLSLRHMNASTGSFCWSSAGRWWRLTPSSGRCGVPRRRIPLEARRAFACHQYSKRPDRECCLAR